MLVLVSNVPEKCLKFYNTQRCAPYFSAPSGAPRNASFEYQLPEKPGKMGGKGGGGRVVCGGGGVDAAKQQKAEFRCAERVMSRRACIFWELGQTGGAHGLACVLVVNQEGEVVTD